MRTVKKIFLPKWQRWFITPLMAAIVGLLTYIEFYSDIAESERLGLPGYLIVVGIMIFITAITWAMSSGKLPAYVIEEENKDTE